MQVRACTLLRCVCMCAGVGLHAVRWEVCWHWNAVKARVHRQREVCGEGARRWGKGTCSAVRSLLRWSAAGFNQGHNTSAMATCPATVQGEHAW